MNYETRLKKFVNGRKQLTNGKAEAIATLRDESVIIKCVFLDQTSEGDFLISIMKAESFETSRESVQKSLHEIDKFHRQLKKKLGNRESLSNFSLI